MEKDPQDVPLAKFDLVIDPAPNTESNPYTHMPPSFRARGTCCSWIKKVTVAILNSDASATVANGAPQDAMLTPLPQQDPGYPGSNWETGSFGSLAPISAPSCYRVQATFYENDSNGMPSITTTFITVKINVP
jgi:hypothetical protein